MIYSDRERLGISILLSLILFLILFIIFDYLVDIELMSPKVIRPPLIVSFYEEKPAPLREERKDTQSEEKTPVSEEPKQSSRTQKRPTPAEPKNTVTESAGETSRTGNWNTVEEPAPVSWGDEAPVSEPFVPEENAIDYGENTGKSAPAENTDESPTVEVVEDTTRYSDTLDKIREKSVSDSSGGSSSSADLDGSSPSSFYSDSPQSLDEITETRRLEKQPKPVAPAGSLYGRKELYVEVEFEIDWTGKLTNLHFIPEISYYEVEQAIRKALSQWKFEAAPRDTPNARVLTGFIIRAR